MPPPRVSPVVRGIVYCNTIAFCRDSHQHRHAREWTEALTAGASSSRRWSRTTGCASSTAPRSSSSSAVGRRARRRRARLPNGSPRGRSTRSPAVRRTTGRVRSTGCRAGGRRPRPATSTPAATAGSRRPGLALARLGAGTRGPGRCRDPAGGAGDPQPSARAGLLPAYVEIMVAVADLEAAEAACRELDGLAETHRSESLRAMLDHAIALVGGGAGRPSRRPGRGARRLAGAGTARGAVRRRAGQGRGRPSLPGAGRRGLRATSRRPLRERSSSSSVPPPTSVTSAARAAGLSGREVEVLRLVCDGRTNREIADRPGDQRAHGRQAPAEHLRQARRLDQDRRERLRPRARAGRPGVN